MEPISHVFCPTVLAASPSGYLLGWRRGPLACVATLHPSDIVRGRPAPADAMSPRASASGLDILGFYDPQGCLHTGVGLDWPLVLGRRRGLPYARFPAAQPMIIVYKRHDPATHRFYSLSPLLQSSAPLDAADQAALQTHHRWAENIRQMNQICETSSPASGDFAEIIDLINASHEAHLRFCGRAEPRATRRSEATFSLPPSAPPQILLLSVTAQQAYTRISQVATWPGRYRIIWRDQSTDLSTRNAQYTQLYNTLWLIANDVIVGYAIGETLCRNADYLSGVFMEAIRKHAMEGAIQAAGWLCAYPIGLKLNDELAGAFGRALIFAVEAWWNGILQPMGTALPHLLRAVGCLSYLGAGFAFACGADLVSLSTFHLWMGYRVVLCVFAWHLRLLSVLFDIFRGKKYNVMKRRTEPATYSLDQLILGTILFTLATFLFPTVLVFYLLLGCSRLAILGVQAAIETALAMLNHFPLFSVLLRLKAPARLPAGVRFRPTGRDRPDVLKLENVAVDMCWIFSDYITLWRKLMAHYSPPHLLGLLLSGKIIAPLAQHQLYSL